MDFKNTFCKEAIEWSLRQYNYKDFSDLLFELPLLKKLMTKGGFTVTERTLRQDKAIRRMAQILAPSTRAEGVFLKLSEILREKLKGKGMDLSDELICKTCLTNWREIMSQSDDARQFAMALYRLPKHPRLTRLAGLLLKVPGFWRNGKVTLRKKPVSDVQEKRSACIGALEKAISKKQQPEGGALRQPMIPGLVPLTADEKFPAGSASTGAKPAADVAPFRPCRPVLNPLKPQEENGDTVTATAESPEASVLTDAAVAVPVSVPNLKVPKKGSSPEAQRLQAEMAQLRKRNSELLLSNEALKKAAKIQQGLQEKAVLGARQESQELKKQLSQVQRDFASAIEELRVEFETSSNEQICAFQALTLGVHPDQLRELGKTPRVNQSLRDRVEAALARQGKMDLKYGTVAKLEADAKQFEELLSRVKDAVNQSLQTNPELLVLEKELDAQLTEVKRRLKELSPNEDATYVIPGRLLGYIKTLSPSTRETFAALDEVEAFLKLPISRELLLPEEAEQTKALINSKRKAVAHALEVARAAAELQERVPETIGERMIEIPSIAKHIDELQDVEIFVDGNNTILTDPKMFLEVQTPHGLSVVRALFLDLCKRAARNFRHMTIVFDSDLPTDQVNEFAGGRLSVVYASRKTEDQNADNWIIDKLYDLDEKAEEGEEAPARWIVTNDLGLAARAAEICDGHVDNAAFLAYIGR